MANVFKITRGRGTPPSLPNLFPAAGFVGTDDTSGFAGGDPFTATSGTVTAPTPSSPRLVAAAPKPMLAYHEDPREAMTSDYVVSASSFAKGGVAKVRFILNGNFVDVTQVTARTRAEWDYTNTAASVAKVEWGYHVNLKHASWPASGWGRLYIISFPSDETMLPRVIGPFLVKRKTGSYYDQVINVKASPGAGEYVNTATGLNSAINAAGLLCKSVGAGGSGFEHVKIAIKSSFTYDVLNVNNLFSTYTTKGHIDFICDTGVNLLFNKAAEGCIALGFDFEGTRFGPGCRIDMHYINNLFGHYVVPDPTDQLTNRKPVTLMGCEVFDSGGRFNKTGWYGYEAHMDVKSDGSICQGFRLLGVYWHDMYLGPKSYQLLRNTQISGVSQDALNPPDMVTAALQYALVINTHLEDFDLSYWDTNTPSMIFTNTSGATITLDIDHTGPNFEGSRQMIWKRNGTTVTSPVSGNAGITGTVTGGQGQPGSTWTPPANYMPADYVAAFNTQATSDAPGTGLNGVSAAMHSDPRANTIPVGYAGEATGNWTGTKTITSTPYTMVTRYDVHGDLWQCAGSSPENVIMLNSDFRMHSGQGWFMDWTTSRDVAFINTSVSYYGNRQVGHNSVGGPVSHFLFWHNNVIDDDYLISDLAPDAYSSISNCIFQQNGWVGTISDVMEQDHNIYVENSAQPGGAGNTNSTVLNRGYAGSMTDLFVDYINRDYRPAGPTLSHMVPPKVPFDINNLARSATSTAPGAAIVSAGS